MSDLKTLVDLLSKKAEKTSEDNELLEFVKGKYFFGVVKNKKKYEGITISRRFEAKYSKREGYKIIDTIEEYSDKNLARLERYLSD
jgi:hypothetical protein